jgi:hypothetical protein
MVKACLPGDDSGEGLVFVGGFLEFGWVEYLDVDRVENVEEEPAHGEGAGEKRRARVS